MSASDRISPEEAQAIREEARRVLLAARLAQEVRGAEGSRARARSSRWPT